jgi:transposase
MRSYSFPADVIKTVARERYEHPDPRVQERMEVLWLKINEEPHDRIGKLANVSRATVQRTLRLYSQKGLDGVRTFGWKGQPSALAPHRETLEKEFRERPPHTTHEATRRIEELTGVKRKASRVRKFMKETLKMKCLKVAPVPVPPKKTVEEHVQTQTSFLKYGA